MIFRMKSDITFEADNIDHAFILLSNHFKDLKENKDSNLIEQGEINIEPEKKI